PAIFFLSLFVASRRNWNGRPANGNDCALAGIRLCVAYAVGYFLLNEADEFLHLPVHLFHALPHLQDDGDSGNVYAQVASQGQNEFQPLQTFFSIETGIALGARGLQQSFTLIKTKGLRMNAVHLSHRRDHVRAFGFAFRHHASLCFTYKQCSFPNQSTIFSTVSPFFSATRLEFTFAGLISEITLSASSRLNA